MSPTEQRNRTDCAEPGSSTDGPGRRAIGDLDRRRAQRAETAFWRLELTLEERDARPERRIWVPRATGERICVDPCGDAPVLRLYPRRPGGPKPDRTDGPFEPTAAFLRASRLPGELLDPIDAEALAERGLHRAKRGFFVAEKMSSAREWRAIEPADVRALIAACRVARIRLDRGSRAGAAPPFDTRSESPGASHDRHRFAAS
ncbi:MAG: hypothetical protein ABEL76_04825 [Bradymonadaceae bacterium]